MNETQKSSGEILLDKIDRLLKQQKKRKRNLSKVLGISENSFNRSIKDSDITYSKLKTIANFFGIDVNNLLSPEEQNTVKEIDGGYTQTNPSDNANQLAISSLSAALERRDKLIDDLFLIIKEYFPEKKNSVENIRKN